MTQPSHLCFSATDHAQAKPLQTLLQEESGQDLIEYALVCALISLGAVVGVHNLFSRLASVLSINSLTSTLEKMF